MSETAPIQTPEKPDPEAKLPHLLSLVEVLEGAPLHSPCHVRKLFSQPNFGHLAMPSQIDVYCDHEKCQGVRRHVHREDTTFHVGEVFYTYASYQCINCMAAGKVFGLRAERKGENIVPGVCSKIYQEPTFGHPIPKRLFRVIGESNRQHFLNARRAIARSLGIGAYAYYRRIVESAKFDLVGAVLEVAKATNARPVVVEALEKAQAERQFSKAIETLNDVAAIPAVLLIYGHNPLTLLHDVLSEGIHELDDSECLQRAQEAEIILCEVAERMQLALTDKKAVQAAIANATRRKSTAASPPRGS
jgi:hypothetical protein